MVWKAVVDIWTCCLGVVHCNIDVFIVWYCPKKRDRGGNSVVFNDALIYSKLC